MQGGTERSGLLPRPFFVAVATRFAVSGAIVDGVEIMHQRCTGIALSLALQSVERRGGCDRCSRRDV